jgi:hypothetical protein
MLTNRNCLLNTLDREHVRRILGGATGHYARYHLDIVSVNVHSNTKGSERFPSLTEYVCPHPVRYTDSQRK